MTKRPYVYILASRHNGTLYVGVTRDIARRIWEHKTDAIEGFTKEYGVHDLVFMEFHETMLLAITREKQIKKWRRAWKIRVIEESNSTWRDLSAELGTL